ncbi:hypothetical protein [Saccharothrix yanglingensis]|uniref:Uncharacterized protein n=1 Tax=Saccharothrix yanglingensis TaxID=659496 RepID=A0ABU0X7K9_9PSEU|nr:hypothetical protein [Saccharothrix yanglingensis]MDQ2588110.1 hypothetical protein [Saccharothrix yanglingensis]
MGKKGRRRRRQAESARRYDEEVLAPRLRQVAIAAAAERARRVVPARENWFARQRFGVRLLVVLLVAAVVVAGHFLVWGGLMPWAGYAFEETQVFSTVAGWLWGGGAIAMWGVYAINRDTADAAIRTDLVALAWTWTPVALACLPSGLADFAALPPDYAAGAFAGAYGVAAICLAVLLSPVATRLFPRLGRTRSATLGWLCVGYSVLLLVWASTLLRT